MAIKTCAPVALTLNTAVALPETQAIVAADTIKINAGSVSARLLLILNNTAAASKKFTIKAGEAGTGVAPSPPAPAGNSPTPPALRSGLGDEVVTLAEKTQQVIVVDSARHMNPDGTISITFEAGSTGFISAVVLPRG